MFSSESPLKHCWFHTDSKSWTSFLQDLQIISTDDNQVVAAIQDWHQNDSYNLYMSESRGLFFTLMLESVVSSGGPEGNIMIDLYEVMITLRDK